MITKFSDFIAYQQLFESKGAESEDTSSYNWALQGYTAVAGGIKPSPYTPMQQCVINAWGNTMYLGYDNLPNKLPKLASEEATLKYFRWFEKARTGLLGPDAEDNSIDDFNCGDCSINNLGEIDSNGLPIFDRNLVDSLLAAAAASTPVKKPLRIYRYSGKQDDLGPARWRSWSTVDGNYDDEVRLSVELPVGFPVVFCDPLADFNEVLVVLTDEQLDKYKASEEKVPHEDEFSNFSIGFVYAPTSSDEVWIAPLKAGNPTVKQLNSAISIAGNSAQNALKTAMPAIFNTRDKQYMSSGAKQSIQLNKPATGANNKHPDGYKGGTYFVTLQYIWTGSQRSGSVKMEEAFAQLREYEKQTANPLVWAISDGVEYTATKQKTSW